MIEKKFINDIVKQFQIQEFLGENLKNVGFSHSKLHKTPLGEKIVIHASRPGLIVGKKGENIQKLTRGLKVRFKLENPQIEIVEVEKPNLDARIVAEKIASSIERFGIAKFKGIAHKVIIDVMDSGAKGIELTMSGKIPSARAKRWRFFQGYLKKSGDIAVSGVREAICQAALKSGIIGIQVRILPPDIILPDTVTKKDLSSQTQPQPKKEAIVVIEEDETADEKSDKSDKKSA